MNKIKVVNNKIIPFDNDGVSINDNVIKFNENGDYKIEYIDCDSLNVIFEVSDGVCAQLFEFSYDNEVSSNVVYNLGNNSSLILSKFYCNKGTNEKIVVNLNGRRANIKYNFSSIGNGEERYLINIYHKERESSSDVFNRTVAKSGSLNYFDINSFVDNGTGDCYLNQQTKIITIGESDNRINPNMFTHEDSTTAIHSSVVGNIDDDDLFYLMSRGIDYKTAIELIIKGVILSNINPDMETRERILAILENGR